MDPPIRDIPGYYYDKDKKKYFKIQPSGATPPTSIYSQQDIKKRKLTEEKAASRALTIARERGRIKRLKILSKSLAGGLLAREIGQDGPDAAQILADGLVSQGYISAMMQFSSCSAPIFAFGHRPDLGASTSDLWIVYDDQLFTLRVNSDKHARSTSHGCVEICHDFSVPAINNAIWRIERFGHSGTSTSISTNEASKRLAMTWLATSAQAGIAVTAMAGIGELDSPTMILGPGFSRGSDVSIYSSTSALPASSLLFAFGTSQGILSLDKQRHDMNWISPQPGPGDYHPKDIFSLEFLDDNPSILLSGGRPGLLAITDLRVPVFGRNADIITHPSSITHIKQLDAHRILVAGLNSSMCQYDLRFRKETTHTPLPQTRGIPSRRNRHPTRPILQYPDYFNSATIALGLDVDLESGIIAAAQEQDSDHSPVQLFSLHGGHKLYSRYVSRSGCGEDAANVKCLRFARDIEGRMKSLYVGLPPDIQRFAWAEREEADPY
ncbi:hypothetical protein L207DRAFT_530339 [Hyaloscypha variabilis F]|uniref:Myocyte-specific enhancer factor 2d n=1 Tax=Hyaloscypha variabilis (strain UAMH 11265 / GT02V1 / F) TaxID=1149755 RepID=A0A2J6RK24_HYAVF|nr:hypothetical protein L207DRAFT_530339 [Hyaloscypha variabilis F]